MGAYTQNKYLEVYNSMNEDVWYTASELGLAAASATAMVRRGLIEAKNCKPKKYHKIKNILVDIISIVGNFDSKYFVLYKENKTIGMLCSLKNERVLDCWEKPYDIAGVNVLEIKNQRFTF